MNHGFGFRDDRGPWRHTGKVLSCMGMIPFKHLGGCLTAELSRLAQPLDKRVPGVWIDSTRRYMVECIIAQLEGYRITTTESPGKGSPGATSHGFDIPDVAFEDCIPGHISSHSMSCIAGVIGGVSMREAACRIQS